MSKFIAPDFRDIEAEIPDCCNNCVFGDWREFFLDCTNKNNWENDFEGVSEDPYDEEDSDLMGGGFKVCADHKRDKSSPANQLREEKD